MSMPDKCIWCGLHDISNMDGAVYYACGSSCYNISGVWEQSTGCVEILHLRKRVATAVAAIDAVTTYRLEKDDHGAWLKGASDGIWMDRLEVENVKKILQGNSPEIPKGST